ncbi:putative membrane protein YqgA involved in biofilm formation [Cytobacillus purgationiresistens]|uniref:Membrane protein YqgA involved in biofilm formation n=2 Tax=Cytobacillus purgationiresistens TaxID=863449 RepID=A0ABU0AL14_9BACI|nr:putative membrane protein YqgA involved in biofilm formation [Cytobacillus purgationiresistens]
MKKMFLIGTLVNGLCIVIGTVIGKVLNRIPENMKVTVMQAIGLAVMFLGLQMGLKSENFLIVILSLVFGAVIGEFLRLDDKLNALGIWLEARIGSNGQGSISQGFVTATLIFVIGAMGIIGALDSGIRGDHSVLYTKSIIDGFTALILTTTLGIGVVFSAVPVILYQGLIALFATQIDRVVPQALMDSFIMEMTATGGVMIFAIGINLMNLAKIRVANLLPGILITAVIVTVMYFI